MSDKKWRLIRSMVPEFACRLVAGLAVAMLFLILYYIFRRGAGVISLAFLTALPTPVGVPGGGAGNALLGSLVMVALGSLLSVPCGLAAAVYLDQHPQSRLATATRFAARVLAGVPSLIIGDFI